VAAWRMSQSRAVTSRRRRSRSSGCSGRSGRALALSRKIHPSDLNEVAFHIHALARIVAMRAAYGAHPDLVPIRTGTPISAASAVPVRKIRAMSKARDSGGKRGASMGGLETSPKRREKDAAARRAEEAAWRAKSGPVKVNIDPDVVRSSTPSDKT
jgi:hypothetical protein